MTTMDSPKTTVPALAAVRAEIARACRDAGRDEASVTLVAVSKTFPAEAIEPVIAAGQRVFGENRVQEATAAFLAACRQTYGLTMSGLMCIPPLEEAPGPHFALTAKIARRNGLKLLSMGMSADFAVAISLGATHVRIGSAIFGGRT